MRAEVRQVTQVSKALALFLILEPQGTCPNPHESPEHKECPWV